MHDTLRDETVKQVPAGAKQDQMLCATDILFESKKATFMQMKIAFLD